MKCSAYFMKCSAYMNSGVVASFLLLSSSCGYFNTETTNDEKASSALTGATSGTSSGGGITLAVTSFSVPPGETPAKIILRVQSNTCYRSWDGHRRRHRWHERMINDGNDDSNVSTETDTSTDSSITTDTSTSIKTASNTCIDKTVSLDFSTTTQPNISSLPDGTYRVSVQILDANGNILESGSAWGVVIFNGQTTTANITISPVQSGTLSVNIENALSYKFVYLSSVLNQAVNTCGIMQVQLQNSHNRAINVRSAISLNLNSSSSTGAFFSDSSCTTSITSTSINAGSSSVTVYYKDTTAGNPTLTTSYANTNSSVASAIMSATITP